MGEKRVSAVDRFPWSYVYLNEHVRKKIENYRQQCVHTLRVFFIPIVRVLVLVLFSTA